MGMTSPR